MSVEDKLKEMEEKKNKEMKSVAIAIVSIFGFIFLVIIGTIFIHKDFSYGFIIIIILALIGFTGPHGD